MRFSLVLEDIMDKIIDNYEYYGIDLDSIDYAENDEIINDAVAGEIRLTFENDDDASMEYVFEDMHVTSWRTYANKYGEIYSVNALACCVAFEEYKRGGLEEINRQLEMKKEDMIYESSHVHGKSVKASRINKRYNR